MGFKKLIKKVLANLFIVCGAYGIFRWLNRDKLVVLYYHRVVGRSEKIDNNLSGMFVREDEFEKQLCLLKREYNLVSLKQLVDFRNGCGVLPQYPLMITFDDGYRDNYKLAYPLCRRYNIPWTLFVTTGYVNREQIPWFDILYTLWQKLPEVIVDGVPVKTATQGSRTKYDTIFQNISGLSGVERDIFIEKIITENVANLRMWDDLFCTWDDLAVMEKSVSMGGHTRKHKILADLSKLQLEEEIIPARKELEERLGQKITSFAYPNGGRRDFNEQVITILKEDNFKLAFSTQYGLNDFQLQGKNQNYSLNRIGIDYFDTINVFKMKLAGAWRWFAG